MPDICVSKNLSITGGKLGLAQHSVPTNVIDQIMVSTGDGVFGRLDALPGKQMIDGTVTWVNNAPVARRLLVRVQRLTRVLRTASPNAVQVRDRWTYKIGGTADIPDPSQVLQSQCGTAVDLSTNAVANPLPGRIKIYRPAVMTEDWIGPIPAGESINIRYRAILWTPPPWADNAAAPDYYAQLLGTRVHAIAFPTPDDEVFG